MKTVYTQTELDKETGELIPTKWITRKNLNQEQFIRAYIQDIGALAKCSGAEVSTILCSLPYLEFNSPKIILNPERRHLICNCANISLNTFNSALSRLTKKNLLVKTGYNTYELNPKLFFYGDDLTRDQLVISIQYDITRPTKQTDTHS